MCSLVLGHCRPHNDKTYQMNLLRHLATIITIIFTFQFVSAQELDCDDGAFDGDIYKIVEMMPAPAGCEELVEYSDRTTCTKETIDAAILGDPIYEKLLAAEDITGSVHLRFIVEPNGCLTNFIIRRDACEGCGDAVEKIIRKMPSWTAGKTKGKAVRVLHNYSFSF